MATGQRVDPYGNFNFRVEIDGITRATFSEASGLDAAVDVTEYREGGENTTVRKLPGLTRYSNIVLRRGLTDDSELYDWHRDVVEGTVERRNLSIVVLDRRGEEKLRWNCFNAWPVRWDPPDLNATSNEVAFEAIEIAHEGLEKAA